MCPFLHIFGLNIPMYGLLMTLGFLTAGIVAVIRVKKQGLDAYNLLIMAAFAVGIGLICGGVLYMAITYSFAEIMAIIRSGQLNQLLQGGIVFYGALIGGVLGALLGSLVAKDDMRRYLDAVVPVIPLGHALGRIGCFCAGCCYGMPTDSALGVIYTNPIGGAPVGIALLPIQLFESAADILICITLLLVSRKAKNRYLTAYLYCMLYGLARFVLEFFRYDAVRGSALGLSTSQWISVALILASAICYMVTTCRGRNRDAESA